jgi:hypothetical protein
VPEQLLGLLAIDGVAGASKLFIDTDTVSLHPLLSITINV